MNVEYDDNVDAADAIFEDTTAVLRAWSMIAGLLILTTLAGS
jgi:hypothetical protein